MQLFHGSSEKIAEIRDSGLFGGLFASTSENSALSHGDQLHVITVTAPLTAHHLEYELKHDDVLAAFAAETGCGDCDGILWAAVIEDADANLDELADALAADDRASASWEAQRMRGMVATRLGFNAVECRDEHGTSWLVLPGAKINAENS